MRVNYKIIVVCILLLLGFAFFPSPSAKAQNQDYIVKPVIFITPDWKDKTSQDRIENRFKPDILRGLQEVQEWYAQKLNGHTFNFDRNVAVVYGVPTNYRLTRASTDEYFTYYKGFALLPPQSGVVYAVWFVGGGQLIATATTYPLGAGRNINDYGYAIIDHQHLLDLNPDQSNRVELESQSGRIVMGGNIGDNFRELSLGALAHELGHTFGLVHAGFALIHTCSTVWPNECTSDVPKPIPGFEECRSSIMCGANFYPIGGFNNTVVNPEIEKLYKSPFINPKQDPAPRVQQSLVEEQQILRLSPNPVLPGEILEIRGVGFGEQTGHIEFDQPDSYPSLRERWNQEVERKFTILEWTDTLIRVAIKDDIDRNADYIFVQTYDRQWIVRVVPKVGEAIETSGRDLIIKGNPPINITMSIQSNVTCGDQNQPMKDAVIILEHTDPDAKGYTNFFTDKVRTDENGSAVLLTTFDPALFPNTSRALTVEAIEGIDLLEPSSYPIVIPQPPKSVSFTGNFHYLTCPVYQCDSEQKREEEFCSEGLKCELVFEKNSSLKSKCEFIPFEVDPSGFVRNRICRPDPACGALPTPIPQSGIQEISPASLYPGQTFEIKGFGFGDKQGTVIFKDWRSYSSEKTMDSFEILEWTDTLVKVRITEDAIRASQSDWLVGIRINTTRGEEGYNYTKSPLILRGLHVNNACTSDGDCDTGQICEVASHTCKMPGQRSTEVTVPWLEFYNTIQDFIPVLPESSSDESPPAPQISQVELKDETTGEVYVLALNGTLANINLSDSLEEARSHVFSVVMHYDDGSREEKRSITVLYEPVLQSIPIEVPSEEAPTSQETTPAEESMQENNNEPINSCDDIIYPDENSEFGCIHKYSPNDPYPNCEYLFDPVDCSE